MRRKNTFKREVAPLPPAPAADAAAPLTCKGCPIALFAVPGLTGNESDDVVETRLGLMGFEVVRQVHDKVDSPAPIPPGTKVVVVSETVSSANAGAKFLNAPVGVVVLEPSIFDDMLFTAKESTNYGADATGNQIEILGTGPLAAGFKGLVEVAPGSVDMTWGNPVGDAQKIGKLPGQDKWVIFSFEAGANLFTGTAAGRRVGFYLHGNAAKSLNKDGAELFKAAVMWAAGAPAGAMPDAGAPPDTAPAPADAAATAKMDAARDTRAVDAPVKRDTRR